MKKLTKYQSKGQVTSRGDQQVVRKKPDPSDPRLKSIAREIAGDSTIKAFEPARAGSSKPSMSSFDPKRVSKKQPADNPRGWATPTNGNRPAEDLFNTPFKKGGPVTALNKVQEMYSKKKK